MGIDGILLIHKPIGVSSAHVVGVVKKRLHIPKVGHAGTLDPFATGLLILLVGKATKCFGQFQQYKKEYKATLEFGTETDTQDSEGAIIFQYPKAFTITALQLTQTLQQFTGTIVQIPPRYSALKIHGTPAYKIARSHAQGLALKAKDEKVIQDYSMLDRAMQDKARTVIVYEAELLSFEGKCAVIRFVVSSGTYIRALARDIGASLGVGAYLQQLCRTKIGDYELAQAHAPDLVKWSDILG